MPLKLRLLRWARLLDRPPNSPQRIPPCIGSRNRRSQTSPSWFHIRWDWPRCRRPERCPTLGKPPSLRWRDRPAKKRGSAFSNCCAPTSVKLCDHRTISTAALKEPQLSISGRIHQHHPTKHGGHPRPSFRAARSNPLGKHTATAADRCVSWAIGASAALPHYSFCPRNGSSVPVGQHGPAAQPASSRHPEPEPWGTPTANAARLVDRQSSRGVSRARHASRRVIAELKRGWRTGGDLADGSTDQAAAAALNAKPAP